MSTMRNSRWLAALVVSFLGLAGTSCWGDSLPALERIGAVRSESGQVQVLFDACPGESIQRVTLELIEEEGATDRPVLWEIEASARDAFETSFTVGIAPSGFEETVALREPLHPEDHVIALVTTSRAATVPLSFIVEDLRDEEVRATRSSYLTRTEFEDAAARSCIGD